jgi:hypothetical protein
MLEPRFAALLVPALLASAAFAAPLATAADESSKPPEEILADLGRDFAKVRSYHITATTIEESGRVKVRGDVTASGSARFRFAIGRERLRLRVVGKSTFMNGNRAFWGDAATLGREQAALAKRWAGHWVKFPAGMAEMVSPFKPKRMARCMVRVHGTLEHGGMATVGRRRAIVLIDRGDKPGTAPGRLYVSASGRTLPLRLVQTGPAMPGGRPDPLCAEDDETTTGTVRFSAFDKPVSIVAPRRFITP